MFYEKISKICFEKGISVSYLVKKCGISTGVITRWKNGAEPHYDTLKKIGEYLGVHPSFLLDSGTLIENNGIIGDGNSNNIIGSTDADPMETELIKIFRGMTMQQKVSLLADAYRVKEQ